MTRNSDKSTETHRLVMAFPSRFWGLIGQISTAIISSVTRNYPLDVVNITDIGKCDFFSVVCLGTVNAKLQIQRKKETYGYSHPSNDDKCAGFAFADDLKELDSLNTMH